MQRARRLGWLTLILVGLCSRPVEAGLKDWLEELSGPGPFHERDVNLMATLCFDTEKPRVQADDVKKPCFFVDFRRLVNDVEKDNFAPTIGEVRVTIADFGLTYRPWVSVPVQFGAGAGFIKFHTEPEGTTKKDATRFTLVAPRLQITPFELLALIDKINNNTVARNFTRLVKFYANLMVITGRLQGEEDFGVVGSTFDVKDDWVKSYGFLIDFSELFGRRRR